MKQIDDIIQHAHLIFGIEDVMKYIDIWQKKHAQLVIEIFVSLLLETLQIVQRMIVLMMKIQMKRMLMTGIKLLKILPFYIC